MSNVVLVTPINKIYIVILGLMEPYLTLYNLIKPAILIFMDFTVQLLVLYRSSEFIELRGTSNIHKYIKLCDIGSYGTSFYLIKPYKTL